MKTSRAVFLISTANVALLASGAFVVFVAAGTPREALAQEPYKPVIVKWTQASTDAEAPQYDFGRLSPLKRPAPVETNTGPEFPAKVWTDAELAQELVEQLTNDMQVLRIVFSPQRPDQCFASIAIKSVRNSVIMVRGGSGFLDELRESRAREFAGWFEQLNVKAIDGRSVTINAPSKRDLTKRFDVTLKLVDASPIQVTSPKLTSEGPIDAAKPGDESKRKRLPR